MLDFNIFGSQFCTKCHENIFTPNNRSSKTSFLASLPFHFNAFLSRLNDDNDDDYVRAYVRVAATDVNDFSNPGSA